MGGDVLAVMASLQDWRNRNNLHPSDILAYYREMEIEYVLNIRVIEPFYDEEQKSLYLSSQKSQKRECTRCGTGKSNKWHPIFQSNSFFGYHCDNCYQKIRAKKEHEKTLLMATQ